MRLSNRLLSNAATTYLRFGATFAIGLFTTWYIVGAIGVLGFGLIALAVSSAGPSHALERALRFGLVRELAAAIASGQRAAIRRSVTSAFRLCLQATAALAALIAILAMLAWAGFFNLPEDRPGLVVALVVLVLCEGFHAAARLLAAPFLQSLFAAQRVGLDNLLIILARATYALSAVLVFGWLLPEADLPLQLVGFALTRATLQLTDVALGIWLARRLVPGVGLQPAAFDDAEYRSIRSTVWHTSQVALLLNISPQLMAVLINLFFGLTYNGIWQIVVQFAGFARMFAEGLARGLGPLATHLGESRRRRAAVDLMVRTIRYQLAITVPAVLLLGLWARPLLDLWVGGRLAADPHLGAAGIAVAAALDLAARMAWVLLAAQAVRAAFLGVERVLYGLGEVRSFAWFSKWATAIALGTGAALMAWLGTPLVAPVALVLAYLCFSPGAVLAAARRVTGLAMGPILRRSLAPPLLAGLVFLAALAPLRLAFDGLTLTGLAALVAGSALLYALLAYVLVAEADERARLAELLAEGWKRLRRPAAAP